MKKLIRKIIVENQNEKMVNILNKKYTIKDFSRVIPFLEDLGFEQHEIVDIYRYWFNSEGKEFNFYSMLNLYIVLDHKVELDELFLEWGFYNCGLGECCDPEYIALSSDHQVEIFRICNDDYVKRFNTGRPKRDYEDLPEICMESPEDHVKDYKTLSVEDEDLLDFLYYFFEPEEVYRKLMLIINEKFHTNLNDYIYY